MSGMNQALAEYFGNTSAVESDDSMAKHAEIEVFCKLAEENGIDLNALTDKQINGLYEATFGKVAEDSKEEEERKKREEAARNHVEDKKEAEAKFAEAALTGQIMAHSMWAELQELQKVAAGEAAKKSIGDAIKEHAGDAYKAVRTFGSSVSGKGVQAAEKAYRDAMPDEAASAYGHLGEQLKRRSAARKQLAIGGGIAAGVGAAGAGGYAAKRHYDKKKSESAAPEAPASEEQKAAAFNLMAAESAYEKMASAGWDAEEVAGRLNAVLTLGFDDSNTKIASHHDFDTALEVRSLELAELAGYPVEWA